MSNLFHGLRQYYDISLLVVGDPNQTIMIPSFVKLFTNTIQERQRNDIDSVLDIIAESSIDVIVGMVNLTEWLLTLYEACLDLRVKVIASNSENYMYPYDSRELFGVVHKRQKIFPLINAVIWQTNFSGLAYNQLNTNGYVIANPNTFSKQNKVSDKNNKSIICVGRYDDYVKRIDRVLECFSLVQASDSDTALCIVGPIDRNKIIVQIGESINDIMDRFHIDSSKVSFVGEVSDVEKYYLDSSVFLLTSNSEGFANVINEAACFGLPLVCSLIPGIEDIVEHGYNGYISEQDDIAGMAKNILKLLSDDDLRMEMGKNAAKNAEKFNLDIIQKKWRQMIDTVMQPTPKKMKLLDSSLRPETKDVSGFSRIFSYELHRATVSISEEYDIISRELTNSRNLEKGLRREVEAANKISHKMNILNTSLSEELESVYGSKRWRWVSWVAKIKTILNKGEE